MQAQRLLRKNSFLALAMSTIITATAGCGGGGGDDGGTTGGDGGTAGSGGPSIGANVGETQLKSGVLTGLTGGPTGNFTTTITQVISKSSALRELQTESGNIGNLPGLPSGFSARAATRAGDGSGGFDPNASNQENIQAIANLIDDIVEQSTVTRNGNTYVIDPDESRICSSPDVPVSDINQCTNFLSPMTMVVTVNATDGNNVTAATTDFLYGNSVFLQTDFTPTTAYFEIRLDGSKALLAGYNQVADPEDVVDIPAVMQGSVRFAIDAPTQQQGKLTLSIPNTVVLKDTTEGIDMTLAATNNLLSLSANAAAETAELEVGIGALSLLFSDEDDYGNRFPVHLTLDAIRGKIDVNDTQLRITGLTLDSIKLTVDGQTALDMALAPFSALLEADASNLGVVTFNSALNFALDTTNVNNYLDDDPGSAPTDTLKVRASAPAGAVLSEVDDISNTVKLTGQGPLTLSVEENGVSTANLILPTGACANLSSATPTITACPASQ